MGIGQTGNLVKNKHKSQPVNVVLMLTPPKEKSSTSQEKTDQKCPNS